MDKKYIHFVGMGGIGMSGLALILLKMGHRVSGSDLHLNNLTGKIEESGGRVFEGHSASNLPERPDLLVYSSSVSHDNPELAEARKRNIKVVHRSEILAELLNKKSGIAITGTHGKTTTTSLISVMLKNLKADPTVVIGGEVDEFGGNAELGKGRYLVAEADESDGSFLNLKPLYSVITNIETEHMDYYKDLGEIKKAYFNFANNTRRSGAVFYNYDDLNTAEIIKGFKTRSESFGFSAKADIYPKNIRMNKFKTSFECVYKNKSIGIAHLNIPGRHNVLNGLAAILTGINLGFGFKDIVKAIGGFKGTKRRFHLRADVDGVMLIDDYAHHPTEVKAVLEACRNWKERRVVAVFQPHRYTRTVFLCDDFGKSFTGASKLILTDIYAASEMPIKGASISHIYRKVRENGLNDVEVMNKEDIAESIMRTKRPGDIILVMGAGDVKKVADQIESRLRENFYSDKRDLMDRLKNIVKGNIRARKMLAPHTSFKIGGPADIWIEPRDTKDLKNILGFAHSNKVPVFVLGNGSNLLVRDGGIRGMVIRLNAPYFKNIRLNAGFIKVGAGASLPALVRLCCDKGFAGIESLVGIPGTVGGAVYMNAGGYTNPVYRNIGEFVTGILAIDYRGNLKNLKAKDLKFGYRSSNLSRYIILEIALKLEKEDSLDLKRRCAKFLEMKRDKQVLNIPSAGCVFKNPEGSQFTCGQMIDMLGLKGRRMGGAEVSEKHANFIVNRNRAKAEDVIKLMEFIKEKVDQSYNITLEPEIEMV